MRLRVIKGEKGEVQTPLEIVKSVWLTLELVAKEGEQKLVFYDVLFGAF